MRSRLFVATALLGCAVLAGCGGDDGGGEAEESPTASDTPSPTATATDPTESTGSPTETDGELTPPGTDLKLGEAATLPQPSSGVFEISVTKIERAKPGATARNTNFDPASQNLYYVHSKITYLSASPGELADTLSFSGSFLLSYTADEAGVTYETGGGQSLQTTGRFRPCETPYPDRLVEVGESWTSCSPMAIEKGIRVTGAAYLTSSGPYGATGDERVRWML